MRKISEIILVILLVVLFSSCSIAKYAYNKINKEETETKILDDLKKEEDTAPDTEKETESKASNKEKKAETTVEKNFKEKEAKLLEEVNSLTQENDALKEENLLLKEYLSNSKYVKVLDTSYYSLSYDYGLGFAITEIIPGSPLAGFFLSAEDIYSFEVAKDNTLVAVMHLKDDIFDQKINVYDHDAELIYSYEYKDLVTILPPEAYNMLFRIDGFSEDNKYLYGNVGGPQDVIGYFAIDLESGTFDSYLNDYEAFEELTDDHPIY